jgi:hypothetical protein
VYVRSQRGRAADGDDAQGARETPTADQRSQERGRPTVESALPGLYVCSRERTSSTRVITRHRRGEGSNTEGHESQPRRELDHRREGADARFAGLGAVFRNLPGPSGEARPRQVDPSPAAPPAGQTVEARDDRIPPACGP